VSQLSVDNIDECQALRLMVTKFAVEQLILFLQCSDLFLKRLRSLKRAICASFAESLFFDVICLNLAGWGLS
jgi:hypothetical protein